MKDIGYKIKKLKWGYAGRLVRQEGRWTEKILEWTPWENKRLVEGGGMKLWAKQE